MKTINFILSDAGTIIGGSPGGAAWLAEREAENADLREQIQTRDDELESVYAERDRLRALVGRMRQALVPSWVATAMDLAGDPDARAAAEWLEAEKAKAAEPWRALAARMQAAFDRCDWAFGRAQEPDVQKEIDTVFYGDGLSEKTGIWLADREAKARAEGRAEGRAEAESQAGNGTASARLARIIDELVARVPEANEWWSARPPEGYLIEGIDNKISASFAAGRRQGLAEAAEHCLSWRAGVSEAAGRLLLEVVAGAIRELAEPEGPK